MQAINDFTCSLTNHNVLWLNIYNDGTLYLANAEYSDACVVHVSVRTYSAALQPESVWNKI